MDLYNCSLTMQLQVITKFREQGLEQMLTLLRWQGSSKRNVALSSVGKYVDRDRCKGWRKGKEVSSLLALIRDTVN